MDEDSDLNVKSLDLNNSANQLFKLYCELQDAFKIQIVNSFLKVFS